LHQAAYVNSEHIRSIENAGREFLKPFGIINITTHQQLDSSLEIAFAAKDTHWCYVLTQDHLQELVSPAIIHKESLQVFSGPEQISLPDNRNALAFFSVEPIALKEHPIACYQLVEHYNTTTQRFKVVVPALPHPNSNYISMLKHVSQSKGINYSYIFL
jgi:hypothetical protein